MRVAKNVTELIGNTPLILINSLSNRYGAKIIAKCEFMNPSGSVKDRVGFNMIKKAIENGLINKDTTIIEPTSGNTGIALASVCTSFGLKLILTMPESMSLERRKLLKAFGAKLELTPAHLGMKGAIQRANELLKSIKNSYMPNQFENPYNPQIHRLTTAKEILRDLDNKIDCFVAGVGTGGTLTGVGEVLKEKIKNIKIYAVEPKRSPVLSGGKPGPHKIQGIGAGFIPKILDTKIYSEVIEVEDEDAINMSRFIAKKEGILVGISSGANLVAACEVAKKNPGKNIVTILCDRGERYLSTNLFD